MLSTRMTSVPAHAGGVDLSISAVLKIWNVPVPAHAGGVDLSRDGGDVYCATAVPAHAGGVDLSTLRRV